MYLIRGSPPHHHGGPQRAFSRASGSGNACWHRRHDFPIAAFTGVPGRRVNPSFGAVMFEPDRARPRSSEQTPQLRVIATKPSSPSQLSGLEDAANEADFCLAWLSLQCNRTPGVTAGLLMMPPPGDAVSVATTSWPEQNPYVTDLMRLAERATSEAACCRILGPYRFGELSWLSHGVAIRFR